MKEQAHVTGEELSAMLDADLPPDRLPLVEAHINGCKECQEQLQAMRELRCDMMQLKASPRSDLWQAISARLEVPMAAAQPSWWSRFWLIPVTAAVSVAATLLVLFLIGHPWSKSALAPARALQAVVDAEITYRDAIEKLEGALGESKSKWNPNVVTTVEQSLADINLAIQKTRDVLRASPTSVEAQQAMLAAYQYKVDFLTDLVAESLH